MEPPRPGQEDGPDTVAAGFEARAAFLLRLREGGIRDLSVLRAMEAVPRSAFVAERYAALATRDVALPIDCGQVVPEPLFVARALAGSLLGANMRVLVIGLGSGYATAVLAHMVREVVAVERFQSLCRDGAARLDSLAIHNVEIHWADGIAQADLGLFDRILIFALADPLPSDIWASVKDNGAIVHGRRLSMGPGAGRARQVLVRMQGPVGGIGKEALICPSRLPPLREGRSAKL